jgi:ABC-type Fe3+/spermidine/putrescine transport system ATPase subunit
MTAMGDAMLTVDSLSKEYRTGRDGVAAVSSLSFRLGAAEVLSLVGPSGCGKTTVLRCVAGLETPDSGTITIGNATMFSSVTGENVPAHRRTIAMVFQSYAIWPHMTVFDNVAYPLVAGRPRLPKPAVKERVHEALTLLQIDGIANRRATQLSGGQQQRVAIARALVRRAPVLLLDEPLSNLDAQLRESTRGELRELFTKLGASVLYVTHDIGEALVVSDRLMVLGGGRLLEEGAPEEIYVKPRSVVVAEFLGASQFAGTTRSATERTVEVEWLFGRHSVDKADVLVDAVGTPVCVLARPTFVEISAAEPGGSNGLRPVSGTVESVLFLGSHVQYRVRSGADVVTVHRPPHEHRFLVGDSVFVRVDPRGVVVIPKPAAEG